MFDLYNKIEELCQEKGVKIGTMAAATGISRGKFTDLKQGRIKSVSLESLILIADYFDISLDELVGRKKRTPTDESAEVQNEIMKLYNAMNDSQRSLFESLAKELILRGQAD